MIEQRQLPAKILAVDDEETTRDAVSLLLTRVGASVSFAENGQVACEKASAAWRSGEPFDVILMDVQMPVLDGLAATRQLRKAGYPGIIIAYSGSLAEDIREKCRLAGCDGYLNKLSGSRTMVDLLSHYINSGLVSSRA